MNNFGGALDKAFVKENVFVFHSEALLSWRSIRNELGRGGAVFYRNNEAGEKVRVLALVAYHDGWTEKDYRNEFSKRNEIGDIFPFLIKILKPLKGPVILTNIEEWLERTSFGSFCDAITGRVMGQENVKVVVANVYNYLSCLADGKKHNNNVLLAAPSGCGKTETFRAIRDYFEKEIPDLPVAQIDMTSVTEEGFKGNNTDFMIMPLLENFETDGIGIIFLDEFDKKLIPSYSGKGSNVNAAVQSQILTLIEGRIFERRGKSGELGISVNTENTMFIGMGAFNMCRETREEEKQIGFSAKETAAHRHYDEITREEIINIGASYELVGRFSSVINYHELDSTAIDRIIDGMCEKEGDSLGCKIMLEDAMRRFLHKNANSQFGCRLLRSAIHDRAMSKYVDIMTNSINLASCSIVMESPDNVYISQCEDAEKASNTLI